MYLSVLQNQWVILTLLGGGAIVLGVILWYLAVWRSGPTGAEGTEASAPRQKPRRAVPLVLVALYVAVALYALAYMLSQAANPPNW